MQPTTTILFILALPFFAVAQSSASASSNSTVPSQVVITSTTVSTFETIGPDRQISTGTRTIVLTSTVAQAQPTSNTTVSGNSTATVSGNSTSSTSAKPVVLPTAATTIAAGGGTAGAPLPGATGGAYGPDDKYIAAASTLAKNTLLVGLGGLVVSGALMVL